MSSNLNYKKTLLVDKLVDVIQAFYQNNDGKIKDYLEKLGKIVQAGERDVYRAQLIKAHVFYNKYLLKNQPKITNFAVIYYENTKKIIQLDFLRGYHSLFVLNKCILHTDDLEKNDKYIEKLYKKFEFQLSNDNKQIIFNAEKHLVEKIRASYSEYFEVRRTKTIMQSSRQAQRLINPLKRDLAQEDRCLKLQKISSDNQNFGVPSFFFKLPIEVNDLLFSFLGADDLFNLLCVNSATNRIMLDKYLHNLDQFFEEIVISNTDSLMGFMKIIPLLEKRKKPIKRVFFKFNHSDTQMVKYISLKQIQHILNHTRIESLLIENKIWTLVDLISLNLTGNFSAYLKTLELHIANVVNDNHKLEDIFILNNCSKLENLKIVYNDIVALKTQLNSNSSKPTSILSYDNNNFIIGNPENNLKTLILLNFVDLNKYEKLKNYYKKKYIDLNISFHKLEKLDRLTIQNFNILNQAQFWAFIKQNEKILKTLELFKMHNFPDIINLFYKLKNLIYLETFSLQESSATKAINFASINGQRTIANIYNTENIPSHLRGPFLERYMVIPSWNNLKSLTLINTNINKSLFMSLLQKSIKYLNISNNHNLIYNSQVNLLSNNRFNNNYLTSFNFLKSLTPNLEILVVAKLHYSTLISPFVHTPSNSFANSIFESVFWSKLRVLDLSFNMLNGTAYKNILDINGYNEIELNVDTFVAVGNGEISSKLAGSLLDSGVCQNLITTFKGNGFESQYDMWFKKSVLEKYTI